MEVQHIFSTAFLCGILSIASTSYAQCSDKEYVIFKKYDAYLDANPNMNDDRARSNFSAKSGMRPAELKDLYFRCLIRWSSKEPEQVKKVAQKSAAQMAAGGESPLTLGHSCTTLGYRYGHTATRTILGKKPNAGWDFSIPDRCKDNPATQSGIKEGTKAASK